MTNRRSYESERQRDVVVDQAPLCFVEVDGRPGPNVRNNTKKAFALRSHVCGPYRQYVRLKKLKRLQSLKWFSPVRLKLDFLTNV